MTRYVVGFLFSEDKQSVAMIHKKKGPPAVVGKLNGIGGKIEQSDLNTYEAMAREFTEETAVYIAPYEWDKYAIVEGYGWQLNCFQAVNNLVHLARTAEEEPVAVYPVAALLTGVYDVVKNIPVLLALALDDSGLSTPVVLYDRKS